LLLVNCGGVAVLGDDPIPMKKQIYCNNKDNFK